MVFVCQIYTELLGKIPPNYIELYSKNGAGPLRTYAWLHRTFQRKANTCAQHRAKKNSQTYQGYGRKIVRSCAGNGKCTWKPANNTRAPTSLHTHRNSYEN